MTFWPTIWSSGHWRLPAHGKCCRASRRTDFALQREASACLILVRTQIVEEFDDSRPPLRQPIHLASAAMRHPLPAHGQRPTSIEKEGWHSTSGSESSALKVSGHSSTMLAHTDTDRTAEDFLDVRDLP